MQKPSPRTMKKPKRNVAPKMPSPQQGRESVLDGIKQMDKSKLLRKAPIFKKKVDLRTSLMDNIKSGDLKSRLKKVTAPDETRRLRRVHEKDGPSKPVAKAPDMSLQSILFNVLEGRRKMEQDGGSGSEKGAASRTGSMSSASGWSD